MFSIKDTFAQPPTYPSTLGSFTFTDASGTFSNASTFGTVFYNASHPYNPTYHTTTWTLPLPKNYNTAWVGLQILGSSSAYFPTLIATMPGTPSVIPTTGTNFYQFYYIPQKNYSPFSATFFTTTGLAQGVCLLTPFETIPLATINNSLGQTLANTTLTFPDGRTVNYLPPQIYYFPNGAQTSAGWSSIGQSYFYMSNMYLSTTRTVTSLNIEFSVIYDAPFLSAFPSGSGIIYGFE
jgi:hypothetical protein